MYIAVKGGEAAIEAAQRLLDGRRRGDAALPALQAGQIREQLRLLVDRVMAEASLYDPELAALAVQQAQGDVTEAVFLLRAYRSTLPRLMATQPLDLDALRVTRRVSAVFKDVPGGQLLGPTFDYTQRLLDFALLRDPGAVASALADRDQPDRAQAHGAQPASAAATANPADTSAQRQRSGDAHDQQPLPSALAALCAQGLVESGSQLAGDPEPSDITREPPSYPMPRAARLQMLARADEGWLLGLGYSTQRGYAHTHPFAGEIRLGAAMVSVVPDELGFAIDLGEIELTDCQMLNQFSGGAGRPPQFTRGQGLVFGHGERKAMAMALVDRALRADEFGDELGSPAQNAEFVLSHGDSVEASGFVQHLKLPHYVTFESELQLLRELRLLHALREAAEQAQGSVPEPINTKGQGA